MEREEQQEQAFHILVVDDEPDLEPLIKQRMRPHIRSGKYRFLFAGDGNEAVNVLSEDDSVDMVVTDINMPGMDGLTLLGRVAAINPDIKSIVVSAYGDMGNIRTAMNRGAFDFVTKPLDFKDFEVTIERTQAHIAQWKEALQSRDRLIALQNQLDLAHNMQQAILPVDFPSGRDFDVHGSMVPAQNVGGDFFDVVNLEHGRIGLAVADVSDKGIPAALFMMSSRTLLKGAAIGERDPDKVLTEVNSILHEDNRNIMFVTILYVVYDPETGSMTYANGGHCAPLIVHADGSCTELPGTDGVVLGLASGLEYTQKSATLKPGETLVMYSDGVSEARDFHGEEFGVDRLKGLFEGAAPNSAQEANATVLKAATAFAGGQAQSDDITCLALHRRLTA